MESYEEIQQSINKIDTKMFIALAEQYKCIKTINNEMNSILLEKIKYTTA